VFSNTSGIDPYANAVSDVYQDLFGEGSYCGKGIYDVDIFELRSLDASPTIRFSVTICSKAYMPARGWCPTSKSSTNFRHATTSP